MKSCYARSERWRMLKKKGLNDKQIEASFYKKENACFFMGW